MRREHGYTWVPVAEVAKTFGHEAAETLREFRYDEAAETLREFRYPSSCLTKYRGTENTGA